MLIEIDFSHPEILEKYKNDFKDEFKQFFTYEFIDNVHCFVYRDGKEEHFFNCFHPVSKGVYEVFGFNASNFFNHIFGSESYLFERMKTLGINEFSDKIKFMNENSEYYGVADNWQQVLNVKKEFVKSKDKFVMTFVLIERKNEPPSGGWRYHKWGEYIGIQNPQNEYLYDDKHINSVICYHFHRIP